MLVQGNLMISHLEIEKAGNFCFKNTINNTTNNTRRRLGTHNFIHFLNSET